MVKSLTVLRRQEMYGFAKASSVDREVILLVPGSRLLCLEVYSSSISVIMIRSNVQSVQ